jgi:hypothetical protein
MSQREPEMRSSENPNQPAILAAPTRVLVIAERGGVWKSETVARLTPFFDAAGVPPRIVQIDQQGRLETLFPGRVLTIRMPPATDLRDNDLADAQALSPMSQYLLDPSEALVIVDVGANFDRRLLDSLIAADIPQECHDLGIAVVALVPMRSDADAVDLGIRTMKRFEQAFPESRIIPVLCQDGGSFANLPTDIQERFDEAVAPKRDAGEALRFPRLLPRALEALHRSAMTASDFAELSNADIVRVTGQEQFVARHIRGDVATHVVHLHTELSRLFGPFPSRAE